MRRAFVHYGIDSILSEKWTGVNGFWVPSPDIYKVSLRVAIQKLDILRQKKCMLFCIDNSINAGFMGIVSRFFQAAKRSFFLFGPRGTGKSTLTKQLFPTAVSIDLLEPGLYRAYRAQPERLKQIVTAAPQGATFAIDKVQKVPELLAVVHQLIEEKKGWQFILTGSSARKLKRSGVDLLAGRAQLKHLHPFMAAEIPEQFDFALAQKIGMLPLIVNSDDPAGDLRAYIALYMREEVQMEGLIRKIDEFSRFLEVVSFSQASQINYTNIARECRISGKTVENYVQILEDLLLSFRLPVFTRKAQRQMADHPKFYFFDAGVFQSIRPMGPLDYSEEVAGHAIETLVAQHLRAWIDYSDNESALYFWRTRAGLEVNFIVYGKKVFYAIEVKRSAFINPKDLRGLIEFKKDYPNCTPLLLYGGEETARINDILCMPIAKFLVGLRPGEDLVS
jgi:predicted AAA+ superfamily ATPase